MEQIYGIWDNFVHNLGYIFANTYQISKRNTLIDLYINSPSSYIKSYLSKFFVEFF